MAELLIELLSEEIPARMQAKAAEDFKSLMTRHLQEAGLSLEEAATHVTPRRLALHVTGLPTKQPDVSEERKGPKVGAPDKAIEGFLKANGLDSLEQCEQRDLGKGTFWFVVADKPGRPTAELIPTMLQETLSAFPWPKSMRWGRGKRPWVRPLHQVLCLFDGQVLEVALDFDGVPVPSSDSTRGHRFLAPDPIAVRSFEAYREKLTDAYVMIDPAQRRTVILEGATALASGEGFRLKPDAGLVQELAGLVEWPVPLMGRIDHHFMDLPPEVLTTSMRTHQKYFSVERIAEGGAGGIAGGIAGEMAEPVEPAGDEGESVAPLAPRFIVVANMVTADEGRAILAGNERVLRARLSDAQFFWEQDRKSRLEQHLQGLEQVIFHAKLGTLAEKVERLTALAAEIAPHIPDCDRDLARSAAYLCKADLVTGMVGEFPELQGVMGRYYALAQGERPDVADAIANHYKPVGPNDSCPKAPVSIAVALADKLDTLMAFFAIDEKPTGSKDPFALRRAALGIIRLIVENGLRLPLRPLLEHTARQVLEARKQAAQRAGGSEVIHAAPTLQAPGWGEIDKDVLAVLEFLGDRLKVALRDSGMRHDLIAALFALGGEDDLGRLLIRVDALRAFLDSDDGANLLIAFRRAANILRIEEKKDGVRYDGPVDASVVAQAEEKDLHERLIVAQTDCRSALAQEAYTEAMAALARLRGPVDAFFDAVTVNAEDPDLRANRLRLLSGIRQTLDSVADFARIEG